MKHFLFIILVMIVSNVNALNKIVEQTSNNGVIKNDKCLSDDTSRKESEKRLDKWYRDAKYGAFIHFGVYSTLEGEYKGRGADHRYSEWIEVAAKIPTTEYHKIASRFNPVDFNAEEWVKTFKSNGIRYVVITSKHHDGFAMYNSKVSPYNIVNYTPFKRDVIKELSDACKRNGLKFGIYYSQAQDWDEPDAPFFDKGVTCRDLHPELPADFKPNMDKYLHSKSIPQIEELVKNYPIDLIWFDTAAEMTKEKAKEFLDVIRKYRPNCIVNSRLINRSNIKNICDNSEFYDYISLKDKEVPKHNLPIYFESPDCVSTSYGYKTKGKVTYHSEEELMERFIRTVCVGGNYLLNSGPMGNGKLDPKAVKLYNSIGEWLKINGESIYNTRPNPLDYHPVWGDMCVNKKNNILYIHVFNKPENNLIEINGLSMKPVSAYILDGKQKVAFKKGAKSMVFDLSNVNMRKYDTVIKVLCMRSKRGVLLT